MGRLTEEEKVLFLKYHEYVYRRIKQHNSKHAFLIKHEVDKCLIRLIKNKCTPILCDMYIDYIEKKGLCYTQEETIEFLKKVLDMVINDEL